MRKTVILPRGIPGSGKSTWTKEQLDKYPNGTAVRINNDDLSAMLWNQHWANFFFSPETRKVLEELRSAMLRTFLQQDFITHIFVDNTNLNPHVIHILEKVAAEFDAEFIVDDTLLSVPVEVCIERDSKRPQPVGEKVIREMHEKALKLGPWVYAQNNKE